MKHLSRRTMLRGMMGGLTVAVGLPTLEIMLNSHGDAYAGDGEIPVRMITWFFGNGVNRARWIPGGVATPVTGADYPLPDALQPFAGVREYLSVPTGYRNMCANQITHHEGMTLFNGYTFDTTCQPGTSCQGFYSNAGGPTIDQVAAAAIGTQTPVPSIQIGVSKRISGADFGTSMHALSHKSTTEPLYPERNPKNVFYSLFGNFMPEADKERPVRLGVLDAVRSQAARLDKRLGKKDQQRLDSHLTGISELEQKINALPPSCTPPLEPTETNMDVNGVEPIETVNEVMSDLIAYAFVCDVTRIASVMFHEGASDTVFGSCASFGHHNASHSFSVDEAGNESGDINSFNCGLQVTMSCLAQLLDKLKNTPDGVDSNLLYNSAILAGSDCMDGWSHDYDAYRRLACLVAGAGGGRLVHPGIHIKEDGRNICDVSLTVLKAVVPSVTTIGSGAPASSTAVEGLVGSVV